MMTSLPTLIGFAGLAAALFYFRQVAKHHIEEGRVEKVSSAIRSGAMIFLRSEYLLLAAFVAATAVGFALLIGMPPAMGFVVGAVSSSLAGFIGVFTATRANAVTALAARDRGLSGALGSAFSGGAVMGLLVAALGLLGLSGLHALLADGTISFATVSAFGLGASSVALFARVGGGIYTKSADVGADLAGKIELKIPEDDPRNPGVIADNVGDNVGDIGGMGADMFESYCGAMIATLALATVLPEIGPTGSREALLLLPILLTAAGLVASLIAIPLVRLSYHRSPMVALTLGLLSGNGLFVIGSWVVIHLLDVAGELFLVTLAGTLTGSIIGLATEYFTSGRRIIQIAEAGKTGPATVVIAGMTVGMNSIAIPLLTVGGAIVFSSQIAGLYGVALSAVSMLATVAVIMAMDAYGPIADNAGGIAEMCALGSETRRVTDTLDQLGNTTAAIGKGFAIGAAALTALGLISAFTQSVAARIDGFELDITDPNVLLGMLVGGLLPFLFSAQTLRAVGRTAGIMVEEIRRQFREIPGLADGSADPDSDRCTEIAAKAAMRQMILPGAMTASAPLIIGFTLGPAAVGGLLGGSLTTGLVLALFMANAGGAWDNAKKYVEEGHLGGKGSSVHEACVVGDTIGDPFKDTSGPSLNILLKLLAIVSLVAAPYF